MPIMTNIKFFDAFVLLTSINSEITIHYILAFAIHTEII